MADPEGKAEEVVDLGSAELEATSEEPSSQGDEAGQQPSEITSQLMQNPVVLAALQQKLGSMVGGNSGYIQSLPKVVKRRIKALKKIQFEATKIEAEFYREVHRLECEYAAKYSPLFEKRGTMVTGAYEPNDDEADWPSDDEKEDLAVSSPDEEVKEKATIEDKKEEENADKANEKDENVKGIPGFWLTIFKNVEMLSEMIQTHDEPILNNLQDVKVEFKEKDPMGFTLEFYFEPNDFFDNKKLTKEYTMRSEPDETDPFSFEGPEIVKCQGCKIDWKKGKNVTVKTVKKKQKHKASGTTRTISKTVQSDSFFNFFSPPSPPDDEEMDEDTEALLAADFEIGHFIRERIVPRAVLYFTGEALENDDEFEDGEEEEGGEEGDYDEDADGDYNPAKIKFVSPAFHARVAQLALGRESMPSSAPPDTRLMLRPNTAASIHRNVQHSDLPSRPETAPIGSEGFYTTQSKDSAPKPKSAFQDNTRGQQQITNYKPEPGTSGEGNAAKSMRPKSVSFSNRTVAVDHTGQPVTAEGAPVRNRRQEPLTNPMEPETDNTQMKDAGLGLKREPTFYDKTGGISRDKTFIASRNQSGKGPERLKNPDLQTLVEVGTSEVDQSCDEANTKDKRKLTVPKLDITKDKGADAKTGQVRKKALQNPEHDGNREPDNCETKKAVTNTEAVNPADKHSRGHSSANPPEMDKHAKGASKPAKTAKDEARNILQRLTGKQGQRPHRAGQVPTVNRPVRKYTFQKPVERPQEKPPEDVGGNGKPVSAPAAHSRSLSTPANRRGVQDRTGRQRPAPARIQAGGELDNRNLGIKPASAPVHKRSGSQEARSGVRPRADASAKVPRDPQHADKPDSRPQAGSGVRPRADASTKVPRDSHHADKPDSRPQAGGDHDTASSGQRGRPRGVRMQNAMIATSLEASGPDSHTAEHGEDLMEEEEDNLSGIHPKLRDSPYLKENPLYNKSMRSRPSGGSSVGRRQGGNPG